MKLFTIFGNPVSHSFSPKIHNASFKKMGLHHHSYVRTKVEDGNNLKEVFKTLGLSGANVTVPHKEFAYSLADEVRGVAQVIGAVNTLVLEDGKLIGYNTDAPGFFKNISTYGDFQKILIIGAGGTAKAIATVFKDEGKEVTVLNRSKKRLDYFKENGFKASTWDEFTAQEYDLVVNTTSAGLEDDSLPVPQDLLENILNSAPFCADVIYGKETSFLRYCKSRDLKTADGSGMLIWQGVLAFKKFVPTSNESEIAEVMKKAFYL